MSKTVDLNSDLGESWGAYKMGADQEMLEIVSSANVACGYHAGDPNIMRETLEIASKNHVGIGAHPSFNDLWGFGRRRIAHTDLGDVERMVIYQIGALQAIAAMVGTTVTHVKSHGSLGNMSAEDDEIAAAVARATRGVDPNLILMTMPGQATERQGEAHDLRIVREVYADRAYADNGNLAPRAEEGAMIHDAGLAAERIVTMLEEQAITCKSGKKIPAKIDTICVHGDNPVAVAMARRIRDEIENAGYKIAPFHRAEN